MFLHENSTELPKERSGRRKCLHSGKKPTVGLYPSLSNQYSWDVCVAGSEPGLTAKLHPVTVQEETKLEMSSRCANFSFKSLVVSSDAQIKRLLSINEKWAKEYRTMEQYYKKKLRISQTPKPHHYMENKAKMGTNERNLRTEGEDTDGELLKVQKEAKELRVQNRALTCRVQHQTEEIDRLNSALAVALNTAQPVNVSSNINPEIWRHQAEVYKEDFLSEHKDKKNLKEKCLELEKKFRKIYFEMHAFKAQMSKTNL